MFTDNKDFYPTPEAIINKMLCDIDFKMIHSILEPSAGKVEKYIHHRDRKTHEPIYHYQCECK